MLGIFIFCAVVSLVDGGRGFSFDTTSQCEIMKRGGDQVDCYPAGGGCPSGTSPISIGCNVGNICCYGDPTCIDIDCGDNGTCENDVCICEPGFNGTFCETDMCDIDTPCSNNSVCNRLPQPETFNCTCDAGYSGPLCDQIDCGFELPTPRFLNPDEDTKGSNSWVVRFGIENVTYCTGVIVAEQYVVTDLMCALLINMSGFASDVYIGDHDVTAVDDTETAYEMVEMYFHDNAPTVNYTEAVDMFENNLDSLLAENIVLIKLNDTITKGHGVNKACPPKPSSDFGCDPICKVSAFGTTTPYEYTTPPAVRQVVPATLTIDKVCQMHRRSEDMPVATKCGVLLKNDSGICFSDHGGALVCQDEATQRWSLQGILLFRPAFEYGAGYYVCSENFFLYSDVYSLWPQIAPLMV